MSKGVAITGMGIISAIGNNVAENYNALSKEEKEFPEFLRLDTIHKDSIMVGEIDAIESMN